jgi:senataxin
MTNINDVLYIYSKQDDENCMTCFSKGKNSPAPSCIQNMISSYNLNDSQEAAVLSCIGMRDCNHQNPVNLIWGPPGTGKTKTVGLLLHALLKMKCRTLTCAPTNIAVLEVTTRLLSSAMYSLGYDTYGLGDIVLFGNGERMQIVDRIYPGKRMEFGDRKDERMQIVDRIYPGKRMKFGDRKDLLDVFLEYRAHVLEKCFAHKSGWRNGLESMISLLDDPKLQYEIYLEKKEKEKMEEEKRKEERKKEGKRKEEKRKEEKRKEGKRKEEKRKEENNKRGDELKKDDDEPKKDDDNPLTFEEFLKKTFRSTHEQLEFCMVNLYTHLPTSFLPLEVVKEMRRALTLLKSLEPLFRGVSVANERLKHVHNDFEDMGSSVGCLAKSSIREECLHVLRYLQLSLTPSVPNITYIETIKNFCLKNAILVFCTASSSAKLHRTKAKMEILVVDEAAQLKECESAIPLQLSGVCNAILIGDERQLPAMVKSEVRVLSLGSFVFLQIMNISALFNIF